MCRLARCNRLLIILICLFFPTSGEISAASTESPAPALCLEDLERMALQYNPTLVQANAGVEASRGKALQAGLFLNPMIGYVGEQIGIAGTAGEMQGGFVSQTIVTAGKLRLSRAKYSQEAYEAELRALAQQLRVLNGVRTGYYEVLAVQQLVVLRRELLRNAEESLRTHKEMFNTGQANRPDVLLTEVEVSQARIALCSEENRYRSRWESLTAVVGKPDLGPVWLQGSLERNCPPLDWDCWLQRLLQDSPELQAAQAHVVRDQISLRREQRQPIPNVTVAAATGWNAETSNTVASTMVGVNIPLWDRNQGTIRQVKADLTRSVAEVNRLELFLRQQLAQAFNHYLTALATVNIYQEINLPRTKEAHELQQEMYQKRRSPWMDVVRMERGVLHTRTEYTQHLLTLRKAEIVIEGLLLVDGLSQPPLPVSGGHLDATPKPR